MSMVLPAYGHCGNSCLLIDFCPFNNPEVVFVKFYHEVFRLICLPQVTSTGKKPVIDSLKFLLSFISFIFVFPPSL